MPYADHDFQLEYYHLWYTKHRNQHLEKMTKYYYDNRTKILKQHKLKYKMSKNKKNTKINFQSPSLSGQTKNKHLRIIFYYML